jgi:hypothetical protein
MMNHFVEAMYHDGKAFQYHQLKLKKIKDGIVIDPQI